jgi:hypothetical protein
MAFPVGWPPKPTDTIRSFRFYQSGTTTANFSDNAWLFGDAATVNQPLPYVAPGSLAPVVVPQSWGGGQNPNDAANGVAVPKRTLVGRFFRIYNDAAAGSGAIIEFSFDGTTVHGTVYENSVNEYEDRAESGLCIRTKFGTANSPFRVEGW